MKPTELKWDEVEAAAERILKVTRDVGFAAPEMWQRHLDEVAKQMSRIAEVLCLSGPSTR